MACENSDHERFRGVMFAKNGCLACETEELSRLTKELQCKLDSFQDAQKGKAYLETHRRGTLEIYFDVAQQAILANAQGPIDVGVQISDDGRIWVCVDGIALLRFKPCLEDRP